MKKKLKEFRQMLSDAKAAWLKARKEKKAEAEQKAALDDYQAKQALMDSFEADGKKDDDEVEIPEAKGADNVIELGEIGNMITKAVETALKDKLPEGAKEQVTEESIKKVVAEAIKASKMQEPDMEAKDVKALVEKATETAIKNLRVPSKFRFNTDDLNNPGGDNHGDNADDAKMMKRFGYDIEMPNSLTKGNLPLHMKQLLNRLLRKPENDGVPDSMLRVGQKLADRMFNDATVKGVKALTTTVSGSGSEWVPRNLSSELYRRLYLASQIAQVFMAREITQPSDPYDLPFSTTRPTFYLGKVQNAETKASTPGSAKIVLQTQKLIALVQYSYEENEDAIIAVLPLIETLIGEAAAAAYESALINGDNSATHQDSDVTDPLDVRKAWKGFRNLALGANLKVDLSAGGITRANVLSLKKKLDKWGVRPSDLMFICPPVTHGDFLGLDDVVTLYARGPEATGLTGELPSYYGIPITISEQAREDLNAAAVYDGITTSKGSLLLVNHAQFVTGVKREFTIEVDRNIRSQTNDIVASFRKSFSPTDTPSGTIKTLAIGYNYNL